MDYKTNEQGYMCETKFDKKISSYYVGQDAKKKC